MFYAFIPHRYITDAAFIPIAILQRLNKSKGKKRETKTFSAFHFIHLVFKANFKEEKMAKSAKAFLRFCFIFYEMTIRKIKSCHDGKHIVQRITKGMITNWKVFRFLLCWSFFHFGELFLFTFIINAHLKNIFKASKTFQVYVEGAFLRVFGLFFLPLFFSGKICLNWNLFRSDP